MLGSAYQAGSRGGQGLPSSLQIGHRQSMGTCTQGSILGLHSYGKTDYKLS